MESRKMVLMTLFSEQQWRNRHKEETYGHGGRGGGRRKWQPTPVFLPGESQGRGSLVGCHLWGHTELDTTEVNQEKKDKYLILMHIYDI